MIRTGDTICAPATASGGAIAVVRISGPESLVIAGKIFVPGGKKTGITAVAGNTILFGEIIEGPEVIDEVLVSVFRAPHSYTGEDSVEISCHGSSFIQKRILELFIRNGARPAKPGEFTQRAFLNGKMDLSQAEAVADLVKASGEASHRLAMNQMRGGFSAEILKLRDELLHFASLIELELDFGEEDVEFADRTELKKIVGKVSSVSGTLADSFLIGNAIKTGIPVAIVGKPNSGKSTLLNTLLLEEKAIVSEIPGTTRDVIEDTLIIKGIEYRFIDTAGLRETNDIIENLGIKKTREKIIQASVILLIDELNDEPDSINHRADNIREIIRGSGKKLILVINKSDTGTVSDAEELRAKIRLDDGESVIFISAREKTGIDELRDLLAAVVESDKLFNESVIITNIRHYEALIKVSDSLRRVMDGLDSGIPDDLIAIDIRQAIHYLGEITGEITTDEILGNIFRNFCIGK
jgi:tRNA modification GTPase